jgi:hypothetical protein
MEFAYLHFNSNRGTGPADRRRPCSPYGHKHLGASVSHINHVDSEEENKHGEHQFQPEISDTYEYSGDLLIETVRGSLARVRQDLVTKAEPWRNFLGTIAVTFWLIYWHPEKRNTSRSSAITLPNCVMFKSTWIWSYIAESISCDV